MLRLPPTFPRTYTLVPYPTPCRSGKHTGRSANDKCTVCDAETESTIWWGKSNKPMTPEHFATLKDDFLAQLATKETLFAQDLFGGSQPEYRSEEHTSELQSLMHISYAVFCLKKKTNKRTTLMKHVMYDITYTTHHLILTT